MDTNGNTKKLLIKDLSSRLPYKVIVDYAYNVFDVRNGNHVKHGSKCILTCSLLDVFMSPRQNEKGEYIKPYLFPLSSMTEEMLEELNANGFFKYRDTIANVSHLESKNGISKEIYTYIDIESISFLTEYFHYHHIDYRGLIPMGLAIDATGLNIY